MRQYLLDNDWILNRAVRRFDDDLHLAAALFTLLYLHGKYALESLCPQKNSGSSSNLSIEVFPLSPAPLVPSPGQSGGPYAPIAD